MRGMLLGLAVMVSGGVARGEVVINAYDNAGTATTFSAETSYVRFQTTASNYKLTSVSIWGNNASSGSISFKLIQGARTASAPTAGSEISASGGFSQSVFTVNSGEQKVDLPLPSGFTGYSLIANQEYTLEFNIVGSLNLATSTVQIVGQGPFSYVGNDVNDPAPFYSFQINAAVPEPDTLLLGGIAVACGGGGVWWRRKRKPQVAETVETVTAV